MSSTKLPEGIRAVEAALVAKALLGEERPAKKGKQVGTFFGRVASIVNRLEKSIVRSVFSIYVRILEGEWLTDKNVKNKLLKNIEVLTDKVNKNQSEVKNGFEIIMHNVHEMEAVCEVLRNYGVEREDVNELNQKLLELEETIFKIGEPVLKLQQAIKDKEAQIAKVDRELERMKVSDRPPGLEPILPPKPKSSKLSKLPKEGRTGYAKPQNWYAEHPFQTLPEPSKASELSHVIKPKIDKQRRKPKKVHFNREVGKESASPVAQMKVETVLDAATAKAVQKVQDGKKRLQDLIAGLKDIPAFSEVLKHVKGKDKSSLEKLMNHQYVQEPLVDKVATDVDAIVAILGDALKKISTSTRISKKVSDVDFQLDAIVGESTELRHTARQIQAKAAQVAQVSF